MYRYKIPCDVCSWEWQCGWEVGDVKGVTKTRRKGGCAISSSNIVFGIRSSNSVGGLTRVSGGKGVGVFSRRRLASGENEGK